MNTATYFDYATPALAAGAHHNARDGWTMPGERTRYGLVSHFCRDHDIEPVRIDPPKARTFAAIRKEAQRLAAAHKTPTDKDWQAMRAFQYVEIMRGRETPHATASMHRYSAAKQFDAEFAKASDGSRRVKSVFGNSGRVEIPHWDFVPTVIDESEDLFA